MRVWFNHFFSTAWNIIDLVRDNPEQMSFYIIGSNDKDYCVYQENCDEFYVEPVIEDENDYVDWCLEFCKAHEVAIFIPRRGSRGISERLSEFEALGVAVMVSKDTKLLRQLGDKIETAVLFEQMSDYCHIAPMAVANDIASFDLAFQKLRAENPEERIIFKYVRGEGGLSFRVIDDQPYSLDDLVKGHGARMALEDARKMFSTVETFDDLMLMPYLDGTEVSIDCLMTSAGFIAVPRFKYQGRVTQVSNDPKFVALATRFQELTGLTMPFNLQVRHHRDEIYLLEVNARMSGGVHKSCLSGVNIPYLAIRELLGLPITLPETLKEVLVSHIETLVVLPCTN